MTPYQHKLQTAEDSSRSSDAPQRICIMDLPALRAIPFFCTGINRTHSPAGESMLAQD